MSARTKFQGFVEQGGNTVSVAGFTSTTKVQQSFPSATVTVYLAGTSFLATLYTNSTGTAKANPFTADSAGYWSFYCDNATVDITFSGTGITTPFTLSDVPGSGGGVSAIAPAPSGGDDYATLQALINTYNAVGVEVVLQDGIYLTSAELIPAAGRPLKLIGAGHRYNTATGTVIKATATMRSVIALSQSYSKIEGMKLDANRLASYVVYLNGSVGSRFINGASANALLDGFHSDPATLNQLNELDQWFSHGNGKTYATAAILAQYANDSVRQTAIAGTASTTAGVGVITIAGGPDLTTLGIRTGLAGDMVRVGSTALTAFYGQILAVSANTITVQASMSGYPVLNTAAQDYAIGIGWGWYEESNAMNGYCDLHDSWFRANGAGGVFMNALYGSRVHMSLCDFNNFSGIAMGLITNATLLSQPVAEQVYMEGNVGPDYVLGAIADAKVDTPGGGSPLFSIGGAVTATNGVLIRGGVAESMQLGKPQNLIVHINNNGGTFRHKTVADYFAGWASLMADKVVAQTAAYGNTPTLTGGATAFVNGFGFYDGGAGLNYLLVDTTNAQNIAVGATAVAEFTDAGNYRVALTTVTANVNGVTKNRLAIVLLDPATGAFVPWTVGNIAAGKSVAIRFNGYIK